MPLLRRLLSSPYRLPAGPFRVTTDDGIALEGHRCGTGAEAIVFCHGFLGWHEKTTLVRFQEELAAWFTVFAFDLRGHGRSGGRSTMGNREHLDVEAVVRFARAEGHERVFTFGGSMGGIAVVRHAALIGDIDGAVAVSTPARWNGHDSPAIRRMTFLSTTQRGRALLRLAGFRLARSLEHHEEPLTLVDRISPIPLVIAHGLDDHFFAVDEAHALYEAAGEPKRLLLADRFGHAEDGYTPDFARRVRDSLHELAVAR